MFEPSQGIRSVAGLMALARWRTGLLVLVVVAGFTTTTIAAAVLLAEPDIDFVDEPGDTALALDSLVVGPMTATLSARVDGFDMVTEAYVEYGPSTRYGECSELESVPGDGRRIPIELTLGRLRPETAYHYRVVVLGGHGTFYDATGDLTFSTPPRPGGHTFDLAGVKGGGPPPVLGACR